MATHTLDARGLKCPQPTLKVASMSIKIPKGDILEVVADCPTFEKDLKEWCGRSKKVLLWIRDEGGAKKAQVQF
jgi:tRNA 2-thiouridine synthesizing protein A